MSSMTDARRAEYRDNQWGGIFLTAQTGGFMITEANRIEAGLERVMADQRGYYLLAFQPPEEAMEPDFAGSPDYHRLKIEVLRPGLKVRSHAGFFGIGDEVRTAAAGPELQLSQSLESPFRTSDINLDVETSYVAEKNDYFIRATLYIDGKDVVFSGPPVHRTGIVRVILRAFNAKGATLPGGIDQMRRIDINETGTLPGSRRMPGRGDWQNRHWGGLCVPPPDEGKRFAAIGHCFPAFSRDGRSRGAGVRAQRLFGRPERPLRGPVYLRRAEAQTGRAGDTDPSFPGRRRGLGERGPSGRVRCNEDGESLRPGSARNSEGSRSGEIHSSRGHRRQGATGHRGRLAVGEADAAVGSKLAACSFQLAALSV